MSHFLLCFFAQHIGWARTHIHFRRFFTDREPAARVDLAAADACGAESRP